MKKIKNYGYQNEKDFVLLFNDKYLYELDTNSQSFLKELFENAIDNNEKIICWKNRMNQKADILIKYKNYVKRVSIKCGSGNSMHSESVQEFKRYLESLGIQYKIIDKYISYHYGYARNENGDINIYKRLSSDGYKNLYQDEIDIFNKAINKTHIIVNMIDRFIVRGRNSNYDIDSLVCGTIDNYVWILKDDIYDLILSDRGERYTSPHIACLTIGPKQRNITDNLSTIKDKYIVVVRLSLIRERIMKYKTSKF